MMEPKSEDTIEAVWQQSMAFKTTIEGHDIIIDGPAVEGGRDLGGTPKPFLLMALAGCSGMAALSLLKRQDQFPTQFHIKVKGTLAQKFPEEYTQIEMVYEFEYDEVANLDLPKIMERSERYCGVSSMLKKIIPIHRDVFLNGAKIFEMESQPTLS